MRRARFSPCGRAARTDRGAGRVTTAAGPAPRFTATPASPILSARMQITILPQRKHVEIAGRRRARDVLRELGFLPGTAMVIRGDELVPEGGMLEADDSVEIRSVISGGR